MDLYLANRLKHRSFPECLPRHPLFAKHATNDVVQKSSARQPKARVPDGMESSWPSSQMRRELTSNKNPRSRVLPHLCSVFAVAVVARYFRWHPHPGMEFSSTPPFRFQLDQSQQEVVVHRHQFLSVSRPLQSPAHAAASVSIEGGTTHSRHGGEYMCAVPCSSRRLVLLLSSPAPCFLSPRQPRSTLDVSWCKTLPTTSI